MCGSNTSLLHVFAAYFYLQLYNVKQNKIKIKKVIPIARTIDRAQKKPALTAGGSSDAEIATP
jgi:hypothetical protein